MKNGLLEFLLYLVPLYMLVCLILFFIQEKLIFFPEKLPHNYLFSFDGKFEEIYLPIDKGQLHAILFKTKQEKKGVIMYLHGNAGSLRSWGQAAATYNDLGYDVLMPDYRGYGKSDGRIRNEKQLFRDMQLCLDHLTNNYERIVILGYSIGTGPASYLAANNPVDLLILQAPFISLQDLRRRYFPIFPGFLLRYDMDNKSWLKEADVPIIIFHGEADTVIPFDSSLKLKESLKQVKKFIPIPGQGHNGMTFHPIYIKNIKRILNGD